MREVKLISILALPAKSKWTIPNWHTPAVVFEAVAGRCSWSQSLKVVSGWASPNPGQALGHLTAREPLELFP